MMVVIMMRVAQAHVCSILLPGSEIEDRYRQDAVTRMRVVIMSANPTAALLSPTLSLGVFLVLLLSDISTPSPESSLSSRRCRADS